MKMWKRAKVISIISIFICLFILIYLTSPVRYIYLLRCLLGIIIVCSFIFYYISEKKLCRIEHSSEANVREQGDEWWIELLSHQRHDWMNDVQLIMSYLKLNKLDKCMAIIDKIKEQGYTEGAISKLGIVPLMVYLLAVRIHCHLFELKVTVAAGVDLSIDTVCPDRIIETVKLMVSQFEKTAIYDEQQGNELMLYITERVHEIVFQFEYEGKYNEIELEMGLKEKIVQYFAVNHIRMEMTIQPEHAVVHLGFPLDV